ncbi:VOC family protein [uncultured Tateyamaria sp.]|uniref:VOC family protein n=1 Tax=uncultured Tateyamaria sp. TaxID=455651 RepID=UPI00262F9179|nr:VOC family protein [uncultured Tateyamaria sp.]
MAKMVHSCIRVLDDAKSIAWYKAAFDLDVADQLDFETFRLTYLSNARTGFELELTVNKERTAPYDLGDGYGHLAVVVDSADAHHAAMSQQGLEVGDLVDFAPGGTLVARFFFATDPDGYKIEVIQRGGRFV